MGSFCSKRMNVHEGDEYGKGQGIGHLKDGNVPTSFKSSTTTIASVSASVSPPKFTSPLASKEYYIEKFVTEIDQCLTELNYTATSGDVESWADIVYESMSAPSRTFHSVQHVFDVAEGADSVQKLAAFFHDVVYYSIDGGLSEVQYEMLKDIISENSEETVADDHDNDHEYHYCHANTATVGDIFVAITDGTIDANISMTMDIFGVQPGQKWVTVSNGLNEFLSACIAVRCYEKIGNVDKKILASIAAYIELTIPFRKLNEHGRSPAEALFDRLVEINENTAYNLNLTKEELVKIVQQAADLSNRDLANFSSPEHAVFLSNTWELLPESNISLRNNKKVFRISDFALALKKMDDFFQSLDPQTIYQSFRDEHDEENQAILKQKTKIATGNIRIAFRYIFCKRVAIAVLAAIAELTGGDAPLKLFLTDHIPDVDSAVDGVELDERIFQLLYKGREGESQFDIKNSPLAAYLYAWMGDEGMGQCSKYVNLIDMNKLHATQLLFEVIPPLAAVEVVNACAKIAVTRVIALDQLRARLEDSLPVREQKRMKMVTRKKRSCW